MTKHRRDDMEQYLFESLDVARSWGDELVLKECLFCGKPGKMYVNTAKLRFNCFAASCGARGGVVALVMAIEDCDRPAALRIVLEKVKGEGFARPVAELQGRLAALLAGKTSEPIEEDVESIPLPPEYEPCWDGKRWRIPTVLKERVSKTEILQWDIGYCKAGRYRGRIIIPVRTDGLSAFVARDYTGSAERKYLNPTGALSGRLLAGYDELQEGQPICVVEGVFDVIGMARHGYQAVAVLGSGLRPEQIRLLKAKKPSELILVPDPDAVAKSADEAVRLSTHFPLVRLARIEGGDPDELSAEALHEFIRMAEVVEGRLFKAKEAFKSLRKLWD